MPYELSYQAEEGFIKVTVKGSRTDADPAKNGQRVVADITKKCKASGYTRVMLVSLLTGRYPPYANYQVVSSLARKGVPKAWKLAYVNLDQASHKSILFSETLAVKKGFQAKVFDNEEDALNWLNS